MQESRKTISNTMKTRRPAIILILVSILWTMVVYTKYTTSKNITVTPSVIPYVHWGPYDHVSCHYSEENDALPFLDNKFTPSRNAIFFHETSCRRMLDPRQSCSLEAAARVHKDWHIYLLLAGPLSNQTFNGKIFKVLLDLGNVMFYRIHIDKYFEGTPLEWIARNRSLNSTKWPVSHTSDILRYLSLYKYGGVTLDLDVIAARPFDTLGKNWAGKESSLLVGSAAIAFAMDATGREMAKAAITSIVDNFHIQRWTSKGPDVITKILKKRCTTDKVSVMSSRICKGFNVYDTLFFFPIHWTNHKQYFKKGKLRLHENYAYGYHMWNGLSEQLVIEKGSPYSMLARKLCPSIYAMHNKEFGG